MTTPPVIDCKELIRQLAGEMTWLDMKWKLFSSLFGGSPENVEQMNRRTGFVFRILQDALIDDVFLHIAKMLDKPKFGKRFNVTFELVVDWFPPNVSEPARKTFKDRIDQLRTDFDHILMHRHRRIGHTDLHVATDAEKLLPISFEKAKEAVEASQKLLSDLSVALDGTAQGFLDDRDERFQVDVLMRILRLGNDAIDAEREARYRKLKELCKGNIDPDDVADDPLNESPEP